VVGDINLSGAGSAYRIGGDRILHKDGPFNICVGKASGSCITTGQGNTCVGNEAGKLNTEGNTNIFIGNQTGENNLTGNNNTFIGMSAGHSNQTGSGNVFIGRRAGLNETASDRLYIDNSGTNSPLIWGDFANDRLVINGKETHNILFATLFSNGTAGGTTAWLNISDESLKQNITTIPDALEKVQQLRGVNYEFMDQQSFPAGQQMGFIAQEAKDLIPEVVAEGNGTYGMAYAPVTALLVEAMKEQQKMIEEQQGKFEAQQSILEALQKEVEELKKKVE